MSKFHSFRKTLSALCLTLVFLLMALPAFATIGGLTITELTELIKASSLIIVAEPLGFTPKATQPGSLHEGVYQFKIGKILFNQEDPQGRRTPGEILEVSTPTYRQFLHTNPDGSIVGLKGPLVLSFQSPLDEKAMLASKQIILFLYRSGPASKFRLSAYNAWEPMGLLVQVQSILVPE